MPMCNTNWSVNMENASMYVHWTFPIAQKSEKKWTFSMHHVILSNLAFDQLSWDTMALLRPGTCRCPGSSIPGGYVAQVTQTECANQCLTDSKCVAYAYTTGDRLSVEMHDDSPNQCKIIVWNPTQDQVPQGWEYRAAQSTAQNCDGELVDWTNSHGSSDTGRVCYIKYSTYTHFT